MKKMTREFQERKVCRKEHGKKSAVLIALTLALSLAACGSSNHYDAENVSSSSTASKGDAYFGEMTQEVNAVGGNGWSDGYAMDSVEMASPSMSGSSGSSGNGSSASSSTVSASAAYLDSRKLIRTVDLQVETKEFDDLMVELETQIENLGGYIENMYTYNGSNYSNSRTTRNANMMVRIPKQKLKDFTSRVSEVGNVVSRSEDVQDVTLSYVDMESQRDALRIQQERLLELLEKAETLEDMLTLEDRLTRVRYQLESMESQLRTYDNKVDFATVYLDIREVKELTPVIEEEETPWERMVNGFVDSLKDVGEGFMNFGIWIVVHIPYLVVWAVVILIIVLIIKGIIRRNRKKKAAKYSAEPVQQTEK